MSPDQVADWLGRARWRAAAGLAAGLLEERLTAARAALAAGAPALRAGRHKALYALALAGREPDHLLKVRSHRHATLGRRLGAGAAAHELDRAQRCAVRGLPAPLPLAAGTVRRLGLLEASLLLVPIVPGAIDLARLWDGGRAGWGWRREAAPALGALVRTMHEAGVDQDDLAPNNFLWRDQPEPRLLVVDFERVRLAAAVSHARRAEALARLDRHLAGASTSDRLRFLRGYAGAQDARAWWRAVADAHGPLAARDFAHLRRTGTRASRRFVPVAAPGVRGWALRGAPLDAALRALEGPGDGFWVLPLGPLARPAAARAWAAALTLAQRRAAPPPIAILCRRSEWTLVSERTRGARPLAACAPAAVRPALVRLLDRLLAFGFEPTALALGMLAFEADARRAELLDPRGLRPGLATLRAGAAREWAARLLPDPAPGAQGAAGAASV